MTDLDFLTDLLKSGGDQSATNHWPAPEQHGPLRRFEKGSPCMSTFTSRDKKQACRSFTYYKLYGIPTCTIHALLEMNERLYQYEDVSAA